MPTDFSIESILRTDKEAGNEQQEQKHRLASSSWQEKEGIKLRLDGAALWRRFHALGTEMIVTKSGRRMFPTLAVSVADLSPSASYSLMVDLNPVDKKRYRYSFHQSKWIATGPGEAELPSRVFVHPDSPANGLHWMRSSVSFDKIKLTNNQLDQSGHIIVNSMHRYRPRIHVLKHDEPGSTQVFEFPETTFIAVTAYQNHRITSLKIESNPFAKGFRECELDDPRLLTFLLPFYGLSLPLTNTTQSNNK
ncbi:hypothetical protein WR25_01317 [Diploscapter pachys]|uniref:T-box domain-containing protein n=1 Tax=Diploscapter pachys TaxID=2018661 RepID=A0A2A2L7P0_9BILA|nr:hypothetical protein WR25_01317 [Diploscapter pachys]